MSGRAISRVAIIGTGVIGASWAALYLAQGLDVAAWDPAPGAEGELRRLVAAHWPVLEAIGLDPGASIDRLSFAGSAEEAVAGAQFVQENGPESVGLKRDLFRQLDAAAAAETILATSSSTIMVSEFQDACARHPERVVLGHPFNPPHLIPLVEVAGGQGTAEQVIQRTLDFYRAVGKRPIRLRREVRGHIANRLQAALWQEAFHLVQAGIASVEDVDTAIAHGPGVRWALLGPFMNLHLSGGPGGIEALFAKPLWQATEGTWRDLGQLSVDAPLASRVANGVADELAGHDQAELTRQRDEALVELLRLKARALIL
jgi:3-hydroxyacyl-CoA dehydrogenase